MPRRNRNAGTPSKKERQQAEKDLKKLKEALKEPEPKLYVFRKRHPP